MRILLVVLAALFIGALAGAVWGKTTSGHQDGSIVYDGVFQTNYSAMSPQPDGTGVRVFVDDDSPISNSRAAARVKTSTGTYRCQVREDGGDRLCYFSGKGFWHETATSYRDGKYYGLGPRSYHV